MAAITIVIPTYNRNEQLSEVLDYILQANTKEFSHIEVIVVDDGSPISAEYVVKAKKSAKPFELQYVYQENGGPAKARNNGFQLATNELVLFIDDDVLVTPDLLMKHVHAHLRYPKSVVFGPYPYQIPPIETSAYRYLAFLVAKGIAAIRGEVPADFIRSTTVASGNISFEKAMFPNGVYNPEMKIPAAEEFDLILRLRKENVPVLLGFELLAWHTQPTFMIEKCKQEYKYGMGISEVSSKNETTLEVDALRTMYYENGLVDPRDSAKLKTKKFLKSIFARKICRESLLRIITYAEKLTDSDKLLFPAYRFIVGVFLFAGIRDGIKEFSCDYAKNVSKTCSCG